MTKWRQMLKLTTIQGKDKSMSGDTAMQRRRQDQGRRIDIWMTTNLWWKNMTTDCDTVKKNVYKNTWNDKRRQRSLVKDVIITGS